MSDIVCWLIGHTEPRAFESMFAPGETMFICLRCEAELLPRYSLPEVGDGN